MASRTHLFLAGSIGGWGEVLMGIKLGRQLVARGDKVLFLGSSTVAPAFRDSSFRFGQLDAVMNRLDEAIPALVMETRSDTLVLCDVTTVYARLALGNRDLDCIDRLPIPVVALDVWDVRRTGLEWDTGALAPLPPEVMRPYPRLIPSPMARPDGADGVYDALPEPAASSAAERAEVRRALGLGAGERLVLLPEASWQVVEAQRLPWQRRIAGLLHERLGALLARAGAGGALRLLHVGPAASAALEQALGDGYRWRGQMPGAEFGRLLAASDLMLTCNTAGTTVASAIAAGVPVLLGINSFAGETADEIAAELPRPPTPQLRGWLERVAPLSRFRIWPLGLHAFLAPVVAGNPYDQCFRTVELLDDESVAAGLAALLDDAGERARIGAEQAELTRRIRALPSALDWFDRYV